MMGFRDRPVPPIDGTLRRVVVLFRILAFVWMVSLASATLATDEGASRGWVVAAIAVSAVVTAATLVLGRERRLLASTWWLVIDGAAVAFLSVAPGLAEAKDLFYGGMPLSWLLLVVYAYSSVLVAAAATVVLVLAQIVDAAIGVKVVTATQLVGRVAVFAVSAAAYGWAMFAIRRTDERRVVAERERDEERRERELADERERVALHLHDSVLQTLVLIRQAAQDADRVSALARRQERELRSWLDQINSDVRQSFRAAMRGMAGEVEDVCEIEIKGVYVGDAELEPALNSLVQASREALVNVARHAGVDEATLLVEVRKGDARVVVRDRGRGFDPDAVSGTGIQKSVRDRLGRHDGTAKITSKPGRTEVELCVPIGAGGEADE